MTKPGNDQTKTKRNSKELVDSKKNNLNSEENDDVDNTLASEVLEEDSTSSILTDEEEDVSRLNSSGDDTDEAMAKALDTVLKQATESKVVIPVAAPAVLKDPEVAQGSLDASIVSKGSIESREGDRSSSAASTKIQKSEKRKAEAEKMKLVKAKKISKERRDRIKAQVAKQVAELAAAEDEAEAKKAVDVLGPRIPKLSADRVRQQKAVNQARNRVGLSTRYGNLAKLLELHRMLLKGNPFPLIDPRQVLILINQPARKLVLQVYPYFHLVPGVNLSHVQPLIRAWQEKATRILYQLLLVETIGDIARIKKRTLLFNTKPGLFVDAFLLKVDIGLEKDAGETVAVGNTEPLPLSNNQLANQESDQGQPPAKKNKKFMANFPV